MNSIWKTVRVFISSTFRDMQAERDHLVRFVFPRLLEQLLPRHIHLVDVDLRWGINSEQNVQDLCREIIDECRPRFIGILGGRYGWVPQGKTRSITAEEMYYGVLNREPNDRKFAFFYFREDRATDMMIETCPGEFREPKGSNNHILLNELKQDVVNAGMKPFIYTAQWEDESHQFIGLKRFGEQVYDDILASIRSDPELRNRFETRVDTIPEEFAEENAAMEAFIEEQSERFILGSREQVLNKLLTHACAATSDEMYICLTSPAGSGKSALFAYFYKILKSHPFLVINHFVGVSPGSTDLRHTLRRLCYELKSGCSEIKDDIPDDPELLPTTFHDFLRQASLSKRVIILLDAVNKFEISTNSSILHWLPNKLPNNVLIIISTLEGPALEELRNHSINLSEINLKPLTHDDCKVIIDHFFKRYHKDITTKQYKLLQKKKDIGSPLYLLSICEQLRTLGTYQEITERIIELPSTTLGLFIWIFKRLENDEGFRDSAGHKVGYKLVPRFCSLLTVSRYGLSQQELVELLDVGNSQGNIAALLRLLRPFMMRRNELLDFYHDELRTAASQIYIKTDKRQHEINDCLADYFRQKADPENNQHWVINPRWLGELPFHIAHGANKSELLNLFSQLSFLAARVATNQIYEQITDYFLITSPLPSNLVAWHDFLQKHVQRLAQHPNMLISLVNHEGFTDARKEVSNVHWCEPWLRTSLEQMPSVSIKSIDALHVRIIGNIKYKWGRMATIASIRELAFWLETLGTIRVFDLNTMQQTDTALYIGRDRPLVMSCAPDATSIVIFYETGKAELYQCIFGYNNWPTNLKLLSEFDFYLPENENPIVVWQMGSFWYQATTRTLAYISVEIAKPIEKNIPYGEHGELSALVFNEDIQLIAINKGLNTILIVSGTALICRQGAHVVTACACTDKHIAVVFSDGKLVFLNITDKIIIEKEIQVGTLRGTIGWINSHLLWLEENKGWYAWSPGDSSLMSVQDKKEVFPSYLIISPRQWFLKPDGSILLGTTHSIVNFKISKGSTESEDGFLEEIFGGPIWRAVRKRGNEHWLLEKNRLNEVLLGRDILGRLYCALDGDNKFFAASGYGPGLISDLSTLNKLTLKSCPNGINAAVGEDQGGCWFTDRVGDIYFSNSIGDCRQAGKNGLHNVHGSYIINCSDYLIWVGYSSKYFSETGTEPACTFVFYKKTNEKIQGLRRLGEQFRHPKEGMSVALCYDHAADRLVNLWVKENSSITTYSIRVGSIEEYIRWEFQEVIVSGLEDYQFIQAALSVNGKFLGIVNMAGEIACISVDSGHVVATLAGSAPFTAVTSGKDKSEFWLVEARSTIYRCELVNE